MPAASIKIYNREEVMLDVQSRPERGKGPVGRLRHFDDQLPGVLYGLGVEPLSFKANERVLERALAKGGQNAIFLVKVAGRDQEAERAVVREIQYHKVRGNVMHVDLLRIDPEAKLRVTVPVVTSGIPEGVRTGGGALQQGANQLEMECLATDLPARIEIDVTDLGLGESIHVSDLLEEEARILTDSSITILNVLMPRLITEDEVEGEEGEGEGDEVKGEGEGEEGEGDEAES